MDLSAAEAKLVGEESHDQAGESVAAGDVDGDGFEDILVGADHQDAGGHYSGAVYLVLGPVAGTMDLSKADAKLAGEKMDSFTGESVAAGDMDGDGVEDVLVGSWYQDTTAGNLTGAAHIVFGPVSGRVDLFTADARLLGEAQGDFAGTSTASGDVDGDGVGDVLIGADHQDAGGEDAGAVYLVYGRGL